MAHSKRLFVVLVAAYLCSVQLVQSQSSAREMLLRNQCICPCGNQSGGKEYRVSQQRLNWFDAASYCNAIGMSLVTIKDEDESRRLYEKTGTTLRSSEYWIGANLLTTSYHLQWELSGEITLYEPWANGEPQKGKGHCVFIKPLYGVFNTWYMDNCLKERNFICQY
uniref:Putative c-type lectin n=1 Tax=Anopheles marajoara TaxID=58244 RepID=A0A2M4C1M4_9DIPT